MKKNGTKWFCLIIALALAVRVVVFGFVVRQHGWPAVATPDSADYIYLAWDMADEGTYRNSDGAEISRTPGYPALLYAAETLTPENWKSPTSLGQMGTNIIVLMIGTLQVLLDVALVGLTFILGRMLVSRRIGLWAALLQAVSPLAAASCCRVLTDSIYSLILTVAILLMIRFLRRGGWVTLIITGGVLAIACYIRPVGLAMTGVFSVAAIFAKIPGSGGGQGGVSFSRRIYGGLARAGVLVLTVGVCISPWVVRNASQADYVGFSSFAGDSAYNFAAAEVIARKDGISTAAARAKMIELDEQNARKNPSRTPGQAARFRAGKAREIILSNPLLYAKVHLTGSLGFWLPGAADVVEMLGLSTGQRGTLDVIHEQGYLAGAKHYFKDNLTAVLVAIPLLLILLIEYIGVALCVIRRFSISLPVEVWFLAGIVIASALITGSSGLPRYRLAVGPILAVAAGMGLSGLTKSFFLRGDAKTPQSKEAKNG